MEIKRRMDGTCSVKKLSSAAGTNLQSSCRTQHITALPRNELRTGVRTYSSLSH